MHHNSQGGIAINGCNCRPSLFRTINFLHISWWFLPCPQQSPILSRKEFSLFLVKSLHALLNPCWSSGVFFRRDHARSASVVLILSSGRSLAWHFFSASTVSLCSAISETPYSAAIRFLPVISFLERDESYRFAREKWQEARVKDVPCGPCSCSRRSRRSAFGGGALFCHAWPHGSTRQGKGRHSSICLAVLLSKPRPSQGNLVACSAFCPNYSVYRPCELNVYCSRVYILYGKWPIICRASSKNRFQNA